MLRSCALVYGAAWDTCLPFAKFSYNNSYQASIGMSSFAALYGRECRTPLNWTEVGEKQLFGPQIVQDAEAHVKIIREKLQAAQTRYKQYADRHRLDFSFKEGDYVYLKVTPFKSVQRFKTKGKLAPRFVGPFKIIKRVGEVAYKLELSPKLKGVHNVFHISQLRKCVEPPEKKVSLDEIEPQEDLSYIEEPIKILETT